VRMRMRNFGSPSEGRSDQTEFRCDSSRYSTIATSESRHTSLRLCVFSFSSDRGVRVRLRLLEIPDHCGERKQACIPGSIPFPQDRKLHV
jgi:hypothetical protein